MTTSFVLYRNSRLAYHKHGAGQKILVLFHGFGQDNKVFQSWKEAWQQEYTLYSFDLFFHGQSTWPDAGPIEKEDWNVIMKTFLQREGITEFELVGFSLGGKFALATLEANPHVVKRIVLLAADGIKTNFWYTVATYPLATRALFKSIILHPGRLHVISRLLKALHIIDKGVIRFAESQMDTVEKRKRVYDSWVSFRHLKFNIHSIASVINSHQIEVTILVGRYDKIVPAKFMKKILKGVKKYNFEILETGHNGVVEKGLEYLRVKNT